MNFEAKENKNEQYLFPNSESQTELLFLLEKRLIELGVLLKSEFRRDLPQIIRDLQPKYYDYCIS